MDVYMYFFEMGFCYVAQGNLKLMILLSQSLKVLGLPKCTTTTLYIDGYCKCS